jgi:hypothetical protein
MPTGNRDIAESAEPPPKRMHLESESDAILPELVSKANNVHNRLLRDGKKFASADDSSGSESTSNMSEQELEALKERLSNPAHQTKWPFPFVGNLLPAVRFKLTPDYDWNFMGREKFTELLDMVTDENTHIREFWFYGTMGYGKSHLLAALVCYLTIAGKRVLYIPDCRQGAQDPVEYFRAAMLFAWANDPKMQRKIMKMRSAKKIIKFLKINQSTSKILFVIDQMNALDLGRNAADTLSDTEKESLRTTIHRSASVHTCIYSTSANYEALEKSNINLKRLDVYGGLSVVSPSI